MISSFVPPALLTRPAIHLPSPQKQTLTYLARSIALREGFPVAFSFDKQTA
jgi:hypothetical protein